jgi:gamma-glutamylcyclotransferase (GGCT)/AIG2-like uncharacterized protein YtfP
MYREKLFVYGTLQRAGYLYDLISPAVQDVEPATLSNFGLYKNIYGNYPVVIKENNRKVKGELFTVDLNNPRFIETMMMELKAGYSLEILETRTPHGLLIRALTFVGNPDDAQFLIEDGDWLKYQEKTLNPR